MESFDLTDFLSGLSAAPLRNLLLELSKEDPSLLPKIISKKKNLEDEAKREFQRNRSIRKLNKDIIYLTNEWSQVTSRHLKAENKPSVEPIAEIVWLNILKVFDYQKKGHLAEALELLHQLTDFYVSDYVWIKDRESRDAEELMPSALNEIEDVWKQLLHEFRDDMRIQEQLQDVRRDLRLWGSQLDQKHFVSLLDWFS
eukprot:TRINITY_DN1127_c0_g1_i1.p1 TRINITY_DN1127_c0_g1~~TRINITY_DN1127_c0_g1_i1.p1  ORF type:complete len:221 (+),score=47.41 TRINITY_DN1127_c0_g1_i1:69-665(+)